jgi:hypothetical protein
MEVVPVHAVTVYEGVEEYLHVYLTSTPYGQLHTPAAVIPGAHLIRAWMGPRISLDILEKRKTSSPDGEPNHKSSVTYTEATLKIHVFRDVAPYRLVNIYRQFEGSLFSNR